MVPYSKWSWRKTALWLIGMTLFLGGFGMAVSANPPGSIPLVRVLPATADAQAVSAGYCAGVGTSFPGSLFGGGSLAPDTDVADYQTWLRANKGWNIVSRRMMGYTESPTMVQVKYQFTMASGYQWGTWGFVCWDDFGRYRDKNPAFE